MKKKMIAGIMAAMMTAGMVMPVSAADTTENPNTKSTTVGYVEPSTFTLSIPSAVTLEEDGQVSDEIGLSAINVSTTEKVQIEVTDGIANGQVTLVDVNDPDNACYSTVSMDGTTGINLNAPIAEFTQESTPLLVPIYFSALGDVPAGTYSGTITFQASIVSAATDEATE